MRTAFIEVLCETARVAPDLWLLTGDLGFSVLEPFAEEFPERYLNVGVAEQNMAGIAAGLALSGRRIVTYSIVNFATLRCFEQIRNDIVDHAAKVIIVGVGGGFAYGAQGYSHHGIEDLVAMRSLGLIDVAVPADAAEARQVVGLALNHDGPTYIRLGKGGEPAVHEAPPVLARGAVLPLRHGGDALIVANGGLVAEALAAADSLGRDGWSVAVWSVPWLAPFDAAAFADAARRFAVILTAEEGVTTGGLGAAAAAVVAREAGARAQLLMAGVPDDRKRGVMSQETARATFGLDGAGLAVRLRGALDQAPK